MENINLSPFQYKDIFISNFEVNVSDEIEGGEYNINISREVEIVDISDSDENTLTKKVFLKLRIEDEEAKIFKIKATINGLFRIDKEFSDQSDLLFEENAPTLLMSYLRPIISVVTSQSKIRYDLPYLNFIRDDAVREEWWKLFLRLKMNPGFFLGFFVLL